MTKKLDKWDQFFMGMAKYVSTPSKDPSTQTGAVLVSPDRTDIIIGYNGFPRGANDAPELYANRDLKYSKIIHCEMNAVILARRSVEGYSLYTWPLLSCDRCATHMIQAGIKRAVAPYPDPDKAARWAHSIALARGYFTEVGIEIIEYNQTTNDIIYSNEQELIQLADERRRQVVPNLLRSV